MQYDDFYEIKEIGAGGYGTVYTAKYNNSKYSKYLNKTVVLKRFKSFDETPELFINEVSNNWIVLIKVILILNLTLCFY